MSFILDALKKSESERQRRRDPTIAEIPYGRPRRTQAMWMGLVVILLLVNLGVLLFVLWPEKAQPPQIPSAAAPAATTAPVPAAAPPQSAAAPVAPPAEVRPLATEALAGPATEPEEATATESDLINPPSEPKLVRSIGAAAARAPAERAVPDSGGVPTIAALGGAGALNLPELHLDIYSYSAEPSKRFAFINMRKYQEGQAISEGPTVQHIVGDGVILEYRNQRFLLSRQ